MKITIDIDTTNTRVIVTRREYTSRGNINAETLLECGLDTRTGEDVAGLVAKTVGIAVADAIAAAGGG